MNKTFTYREACEHAERLYAETRGLSTGGCYTVRYQNSTETMELHLLVNRHGTALPVEVTR